MEKSKVYFTDFRTTLTENLLQKLRRLVIKAGIKDIDFTDKYVAIKIHFGEPGNLAFLRPNYAKAVADLIKELGGKPFLTDCNTLYVGGRKNALDHIDTAYTNGFTPYATGCHVIIADGIKGLDEAYVDLPDGEFVKTAKIGQAIMDADIVISLNHFKGHEATGFGGAIKNIGMGSGSRAGKMEQHSAGKPNVSALMCIGCGMCQRNCAHSAITIANKKASIDHDKCVGCGRCIGACPKDAVNPGSDNTNEILSRKMAEYAAAVVRGRPNFHINIVCDVSPCCDCHTENDVPIVPDVGMFASFDPVALDQASADAVNAQPVCPGSRLDDNIKKGMDGVVSGKFDHFHNNYPVTDWTSQLDQAEKMKIGTRQYELVKI